MRIQIAVQSWLKVCYKTANSDGSPSEESTAWLVCWDTATAAIPGTGMSLGLAERGPSSLGLEIPVINQSDKSGKATLIAMFCRRCRKNYASPEPVLTRAVSCIFFHATATTSLQITASGIVTLFLQYYNKDPAGFPKLFSFKNILDMVQRWKAFSTLMYPLRSPNSCGELDTRCPPKLLLSSLYSAGQGRKK